MGCGCGEAEARRGALHRARRDIRAWRGRAADVPHDAARVHVARRGPDGKAAGDPPLVRQLSLSLSNPPGRQVETYPRRTPTRDRPLVLHACRCDARATGLIRWYRQRATLIFRCRQANGEQAGWLARHITRGEHWAGGRLHAPTACRAPSSVVAAAPRGAAVNATTGRCHVIYMNDAAEQAALLPLNPHKPASVSADTVPTNEHSKTHGERGEEDPHTYIHTYIHTILCSTMSSRAPQARPSGRVMTTTVVVEMTTTPTRRRSGIASVPGRRLRMGRGGLPGSDHKRRSRRRRRHQRHQRRQQKRRQRRRRRGRLRGRSQMGQQL